VRLGFSGTTNSEMRRRHGACRPTDPKAAPVSTLAIAGYIDYVSFAVEHASWLKGLRVGAYFSYVVPQNRAATLEGDLYQRLLRPQGRNHPGSGYPTG
jgi:hypothetical protein